MDARKKSIGGSFLKNTILDSILQELMKIWGSTIK